MPHPILLGNPPYRVPRVRYLKCDVSISPFTCSFGSSGLGVLVCFNLELVTAPELSFREGRGSYFHRPFPCNDTNIRHKSKKIDVGTLTNIADRACNVRGPTIKSKT